jgi:hypothetical protein
MKKIAILLLVALPAALIISSCRKEGQTVTKTINVVINANQTYTSQIPAGDADDVMQITTQAQHYLTSQVTFDSASGSYIFLYTPALNYTGADNVQVTNTEGDHHGNGGHGSCGGHHHGNTTVYIYNITVKGVTTNP